MTCNKKSHHHYDQLYRNCMQLRGMRRSIAVNGIIFFVIESGNGSESSLAAEEAAGITVPTIAGTERTAERSE